MNSFDIARLAGCSIGTARKFMKERVTLIPGPHNQVTVPKEVADQIIADIKAALAKRVAKPIM